MANRLKMATVDSILRLHAQRWSQRRIADELRVDRKTVSRYVRLADRVATGANAPTGGDSSGPGGALASPADSKGANAPTGSELGCLPPAVMEFLARPGGRGRRSDCEPFRELILAKLDQGLSAKRIFQDLASERGFTGRYWSVRRFVQGLASVAQLPMRRMEVGPGEEAQVDFGAGAPIITPDGKRRKSYVFRVVLSCSRKGYSEATFTQTSEDFIRCLENAFAHFGGVPKTLVIDNLRAAVAHPDWFDPELNPKLQSFCRHYNTVILPTKPYMPRHKGKVESGVKYVKNNGLKGHTFTALEGENRHLAHWEETVADMRIHGTTKRQVQQVFRDVERPALQPLPAERFPFFHEARRKVSRDGHVEVAKAYYSVPPEYLGREVWARWDARLVRIFDHRFQQIALHTRHERGRFSTDAVHLAPEKISGLERGAAYLLGKVQHIGPHTHAWAQAVLAARGIEGTRVLLG
jgi:transposase